MDIKLIELTKVCTKCEERKSWEGFVKNKGCRFGRYSVCKTCGKIYKQLNREKISAQRKVHYMANSKKMNIRTRAYYAANRNKIKVYNKNYGETHKDEIKARNQAYYKINKDERKAYGKVYREFHKDERKAYDKANKDEIKTQRKKYYLKLKLKSNFKLNRNMSGLIWHSLRDGNGKEGKSWKNIVPYTIDDLIKRLRKTLPKGYKWNDYIAGTTDLQIDHILPLAVHSFKSYKDIDFQRCWALKNLQLLPAKENLEKRAKLIKHFQTSLPL